MSQTRVNVLREVKRDVGYDYLCLQQVIYDYGNDAADLDFRFIRRDKETNRLKAQRGQAALNSLDAIIDMAQEMKKKMIKVCV
jgi:hypothetical protein